jgi:hypothetical protein
MGAANIPDHITASQTFLSYVRVGDPRLLTSAPVDVAIPRQKHRAPARDKRRRGSAMTPTTDPVGPNEVNRDGRSRVERWLARWWVPLGPPCTRVSGRRRPVSHVGASPAPDRREGLSRVVLGRAGVRQEAGVSPARPLPSPRTSAPQTQRSSARQACLRSHGTSMAAMVTTRSTRPSVAAGSERDARCGTSPAPKGGTR